MQLIYIYLLEKEWDSGSCCFCLSSFFSGSRHSWKSISEAQSLTCLLHHTCQNILLNVSPGVLEEETQGKRGEPLIQNSSELTGMKKPFPLRA